MKILLLTRPICPPWDEASKNFAYVLAQNIKDTEMHLLTCAENGDSISTWRSNLQNVVCHDIYTSSRWDWGQKNRAYLFLIKELFFKKGRNINILHSFFTPTKLNVFALKLLIGQKKIKTIQTLATLRDDLYSDEHIKKIIYADLIITYSDYAREKLEKMGFKNVKRIYPGIDLSEYSPREKNKELMERYKIKPDDFVINFTGEYARLGAIDDVVESFTDLAKQHNDFHLQLALRIKNQKDADKKQKVIKRLKNSRCLGRVSFLDDGNYKMPDVYNLCDISIFPVQDMAGKFDIPLAVIEAMACGKPVIASNLERLRYFLNNENSILIPPGNREVLKENILYLFNNPEKKYDLAKKGIEFVRENFDIMKIVKEYEEVYKNL